MAGACYICPRRLHLHGRVASILLNIINVLGSILLKRNSYRLLRPKNTAEGLALVAEAATRDFEQSLRFASVLTVSECKEARAVLDELKDQKNWHRSSSVLFYSVRGQ